MPAKTLELAEVITPESIAKSIALKWNEWNSLRAEKREEWKELRNYIFQTSTKDTSNSKLPWKNSTSTPKICQIRDNLHANYMAALFPNENWLRWEGGDKESDRKSKRTVIEEYMRNKTDASAFRTTISQLVLDWIDYGNAFGTTEYLNQIHKVEGFNDVVQYVGPKLVRLSPYDVAFDITASDFESTPKIVRSLKSLGDIKKDLLERPELGYQQAVFDVMMNDREAVNGLSAELDIDKNDGYLVDGFGSISQYYASGTVELLEFYGDYFDADTNTLYPNHVITIADRVHVLRNQPIPGWNINKIRHVGWRLRPDNLMAMGPLDNLVGMQYRIDHLENLKADVFDLIAHPVMKIKGAVEDFTYGPGERIICGDDGSVDFLPPDATALNADTQISILEQKMEDFAGAPKQAMGIRTPGEKTKFEVQTLENASGRIFQNKISYFEQVFMEMILNDMLEVAVRNLSSSDVIRILDKDIDVVLFKTITKDDITAKGTLRPVGARHFATKANMLQNFVALSNSALGQDPAVSIHISGLKIAKLIEEMMEVERYGLVSDNIRVFEQLDTQRLMNQGKVQLDTELQTSPQTTADEVIPV